jgi:hypothetical protein
MHAGETGFIREAGAEGATTPETLRQKDRVRRTLWKADQARPISPTE